MALWRGARAETDELVAVLAGSGQCWEWFWGGREEGAAPLASIYWSVMDGHYHTDPCTPT